MILKYEKWVVRCPVNHQLIEVGACSSFCEFYEGDGNDEKGVPCSYGEDKL